MGVAALACFAGSGPAGNVFRSSAEISSAAKPKHLPGFALAEDLVAGGRGRFDRNAVAGPHEVDGGDPVHAVSTPRRRTIPGFRLGHLSLHLASGLTAPTVPVLAAEARRVRVGDEQGRAVVARVYGGNESRVVMLPDGRLGWPNAMIYTDEPFRPLTADELRDALLVGPYKHFQVLQTDHYLIYYQGSAAFARESGTLLESLYTGLAKAFGDRGLDVHESEFPLVAVIFRKESDFREHKQVPPDVQAYYETSSNRIFFYETRDQEIEAPEVASMRKPQTVAHEGTHQILMNIGVQPRMAQWPPWLVEGLAEFCAPISTNRGAWAGFSRINPIHIATIQDLEDSLAIQGRNARLTRSRIGPAPGRSTVEYLFSRGELSPTDYALAWGLTHYLANRREDDFVAYLGAMSRLPPFVPRTPDEEMRDFRRFFGDDPAAIGQQVHRYLAGLRRPEPLPYYAVVFEQPIEPGVVRLGTLVSQSPQVIRQWVEAMGASHSARYRWEAQPFPSRTAAASATERWINGR